MKTKLYKIAFHMSKFGIYMLIMLQTLTMVMANGSSAQRKMLEEIDVELRYGDEGVSIIELFEHIESLTNLRFAYSQEEMQGRDKIIVSQKSNLNDLLKTVSVQAGVSFKRVNEQIAVTVAKFGDDLPDLTEQVVIQELIQGTVTDETGETLPGATVMEKGTSNGTITDIDGNFSLDVSEGATLIISFVGYLPTEIKLDGQSTINVSLAEDVSALDEVVVIGYGTSAKKNLTGAVVSLDEKQINNLPNVGFEQNIVGRLPGVNIQQTTGTPGGNVSIKVRGTGSISAGNSPLIVIDGFPISDSYNSATVQGSRPGNSTRQENPQNPLSSLNPNDIKSIEVLKDASAAAIYGSRGANGVVLITTKSGSTGKSQLAFNAYYGIQQVTNTYEMMDAYTFAEQNYLSRVNGGSTSGYPPEFIPYLNDEPGLVDTDWQDALFRTAPIQSYDLSARGGTKNLNYYVSGSYFAQDGIILGSGFERLSARANLDGKISDKVILKVNFNPTYTKSQLVPAENPYFVDGVVNLALLSIPTESIYNADGSFNFRQNTAAGSGPFVNPIAIAEGIEDELDQFRLLSNFKLEAEIIKGFKFNTSFGADINSFNRSYYRPSWIPVRGAGLPSNPNGRNFTTDVLNWTNENTLTYNLNSGKHDLNVLAGFTAQKEQIARTGLYANNFPNDLVTTLNAGMVTSGFSQIQEWSLLSYLSRAIYNYDGKYIINMSIRRDGSSRFGENTKWGLFPSGSVGWRLSEESFFPSMDFINDVKLRASIGVTGNFSIPNYGAVALIESANYIFNDQVTNGLTTGTSPNADLSWEKTTMTNYGLDVALFDNLITFTGDYFISNTKDLLLNVPVPGSSGFSSSLQNIGEVQNKGLELGLNSSFDIGKVNWSLNANIATLRNEVIALGKSGEPIITDGGVPSTHITQVGSPIGSYYGYKVLGVFQNQEDLDSYPSFSDSNIGDFKFEDVNGDGVISPDDRTITGDFFPDYTFGFSSQLTFSGFDLGFLIQGSQGFEVLHLAQRYLSSLQTFSNYRADTYADAFLSEENPGSGKVYRPNSSPTGNTDAISSYHVEDGSFVRLRNATIGYTFGSNQAVDSKLPFESFRVYVTGQNLWTLSNYPGYNPEVNMRPNNPLSQGEDYGTYPLAKSVIIGVNINF
ncbi:MAG: TonB-dependent receptor [Cyclobacteriaceae bacterium]